MRQRVFLHKIASLYFVFLLLLSMLPLFSPSVDAVFPSGTVTIRPSADGTIYCQLSGGGSTHWGSVYENVETWGVSAVGVGVPAVHEFDTYVYENVSSSFYSYHISEVVLKGRFAYSTVFASSSANYTIYTYGHFYNSSNFSITAGGGNGAEIQANAEYHNVSFTTNPYTGDAWTWAEVNAAEFGFRHGSTAWVCYCQYMFAEVHYSDITGPTNLTAVVNPWNISVSWDNCSGPAGGGAPTYTYYLDSIERKSAIYENGSLLFNYPQMHFVDTTDKRAYVTSLDDDALTVLNISNPEIPPVKLGDYTSGTYLNGAHHVWYRNYTTPGAAYGKVCFVPTYVAPYVLTALNVTDPAAISVLDSIPLGATGMYLKYDNVSGFLFVSQKDADRITIVNISDPGYLHNVTNITGLDGDPWHMYFFTAPNGTRYLYSTQSAKGVRIYNVTDASSPTYAGVFNATIYMRNIEKYTWNGFDYLLMTNNNAEGIDVFNVTSGNYIAPTYMYQFGTNCSGPMALVGGYVFVARTTAFNGVSVLNLSDVNNPSFLCGLYGDNGPNWLEGCHEIKLGNISYVYVQGYLDDSFVTIGLNWNIVATGAGGSVFASNTTVVRYSTTGYPSTPTSGSLLYNGTGTMMNLSGWTPDTTYYFRAWTWYVSTYSSNYSSFNITTPTAPTGLTVSDYNDTEITLSWSKGTGDTSLRRNASGVADYPTTTTGTIIYNGSAETYTDTPLSPNVLYYYRAWDWNGTGYSIRYVNTTHYTEPSPPTGATNHTSLVGATVYLNITWTIGAGANRTVLRRSALSQPLTITSGNEVYNGTSWFYNASVTQAYYYTLFSYSNLSGYSSPPVYVSWFIFWINVYNESSGAALTNWDIFVTNYSGSEIYTNDNCNNSLFVDTADMPKGTGCTMTFSRENYTTRSYTKQIAVNGAYTINAYLGPFTPPTAPPVNTSYPYLLVVQNEYASRVSGASIEVKRVVSGVYVIVTSGTTDGNGQFSCYLQPGSSYKFYINKTGYTNEIADWTPSVADYEHIFMLYTSPVVYDLWDNINVSIEPVNRNQIGSFTLYFNITSSDSQIAWFSGRVYKVHNTTGALTSLYYANYSTAAGGMVSYTVSNSSGKYYFRCQFQRTGYDTYTFGTQATYTYILRYFNGSEHPLEEKIVNVVGRSPVYVITPSGEVVVSYMALGLTLAIMFVLFTFSPKFAGLAVMGVGFVIGLLKGPLGLVSDNLLSWTVAGVIIILGFILFVSMKKEEATG